MSLFSELSAATELLWENEELLTNAFGRREWKLTDIWLSPKALKLNFIHEGTKPHSHIMSDVEWDELREKLPRIYAKLLIARYATIT